MFSLPLCRLFSLANGCLAAAIWAAVALPAHAVTTTWTGATNNTWSTSVDTNWTAGFDNGDDAIFNDSGANTSITLSGTVSPASMTFSNNAVTYTFSGAAGNVIGGSGGIVKNGSGTVTISNSSNNTFTGKTIINDGVLAIQGDGRLGTAPVSVVADQLTINGGTLRTLASTTIPVNRGITLGLNGGTIDVQAGTTTFHGNISGSGGLVKTGSGTLRIGPPTASPNTFAGVLHVQQGTVQVATASGGTSPPQPLNAVAPGGFLVEAGATLDFNQGGNMTWIDPITLNGGTLLDSLSTNNHVTGTITLLSDSIIAKGAADFRIQTTIQGAGGFDKRGNGTLTLYNANTYSGPTSVSVGTMTVLSSSNLGNTSALTVQNLNTGAGSNVILNLNNAAQTVGSLSGSIAAPSSGTNTATINLGTNHDLTINQTADGTYGGILAGATGEVILGAASTAALTLTRANTYGGGTRINGGTLRVANTTGSGTGTGAVTVNNTGTLGGTGIITGNVTVNSGATIDPGITTGTLTLNGTTGVTFANGSVFSVGIAGDAPGLHDLLVVQNTANISGATLDVSFLSGLQLSPGAEITILDAGTLVGTFVNADEGERLTFDGTTFTISYLGNQVTLSNFQIPEPSSLSLIGLGALLVARRIRRRRM